MTDHPLCHHHVEWPAPGARVAGPVVWVRGWLVAKPGWAFDAVRARADGGTHLGILGFPRADLAAHFGRDDAWLPAEFLIGMPAADGDLRLVLEAREVSGEWVGLGEFACTVAPDGSPAPQAGGELHPVTGGTRLERGPHQPFDGFLDLPETLATARHGELRVFGWLTHAGQAIRSLRATLDGHTHRLLDHGQPDDVLAKKFPGRPGIATSRFSGWVDSPAELNAPACLRLHAELADGSTHLCFARWVTPQCSDDPVPPPAAPSTTGALPALPSGRPRRLLLVLRTLREVDATGRALDVVRHLHAGGRWVARAVATEDGPARARFEAAGCPVQTVDVRAWFARPDTTERDALERQIWWQHLDAVAVFDPEQAWAVGIERRHALPCLLDPADSLAWAAEDFPAADPASRTLLAPVEHDAAHGAHVLRQAVRLLETRHAEAWRGWRILWPQATEAAALLEGVSSLLPGTPGPVLAGVICPAFTRWPHRTLLGAAAAGVPVLTTPGGALMETFRAGEIEFVPPNQPLALAHALLALIANPAAAARRAEAARRIARERHAAGPALHRWQALLEGAVLTR